LFWLHLEGEAMNDQSIEFQKIKEDLTLPKIVRKSFRVPVESDENIWVVINKKQYDVLDICSDGISVTLKSDSLFTVGQSLLDCELNINNQLFTGLSGRIVRFTSTGRILQYAIQWTGMEEKVGKNIFELISNMKENLLKDDSILFE